MSSGQQEGVVLLHGLLRSNRSMCGLEEFLQQYGFAVLNIDYPSTRLSIEQLVEYIRPAIAALDCAKINFIGYSLGGLLTRAYLHKYTCNVGRVVMFGPPNHGSEIADLLQHTFLYRKVCGPAGQQVITNQTAFANIFGAVSYELGIIAGSGTIDPISSYLIKEPSDGKVSIKSTMLEGMQDHVVLPVSHFFMPSNKEVWRQALHFLQHGKFAH